MSLNAALLLKI